MYVCIFHLGELGGAGRQVEEGLVALPLRRLAEPPQERPAAPPGIVLYNYVIASFSYNIRTLYRSLITPCRTAVWKTCRPARGIIMLLRHGSLSYYPSIIHYA